MLLIQSRRSYTRNISLCEGYIIGTKFATDMFQDGDYIEVDADRGRITVLSRKEKIHRYKKNMPWNILFK